MSLPLWFQVTSLVVLSLVLIADLLLIIWRPHVPSSKESGAWVAFYVFLALAFGGVMFVVGGEQAGSEFLAGWVTEYSLSIDNLFVFVLIMASFAVPRKYQQEILMIGILLAILFRGIFILLGAALIASFSWIFYVFGAFLLVIGIQQFFSGREDDVERENKLLTFLQRRLEMTDEFHGLKFRIPVDGRMLWTPLVIVLVAIGTADVVFAVDSIPAIYGITAAAEHYFGKSPQELTSLESAWLALMLPNPVERYGHFCQGAPSAVFEVKLRRVHRLMHGRGHIDEIEYTLWKEAPLVFAETFRLDEAACMARRATMKAGPKTQRALSGVLGRPRTPPGEEAPDLAPGRRPGGEASAPLAAPEGGELGQPRRIPSSDAPRIPVPPVQEPRPAMDVEWDRAR